MKVLTFIIMLFIKTCQRATNDDKVSMDLGQVCERYPNKFTPKKNLDKKFQKRPAKMGKNIC